MKKGSKLYTFLGIYIPGNANKNILAPEWRGHDWSPLGREGSCRTPEWRMFPWPRSAGGSSHAPVRHTCTRSPVGREGSSRAPERRLRPGPRSAGGLHPCARVPACVLGPRIPFLNLHTLKCKENIYLE